MGFKTKISKMHYDKDAKGFLFNTLKFCSVFYVFGSRLKNSLYDKGILKPKKVDAYVICVGNLTTGGVGKTPVVAQIANYLMDKGEKTAIISRGYSGKGVKGKKVLVISDGTNVSYNADIAGDEPFWLAKNTKSIVITAKNRFEGAKFAIDKFGATKIILDDGFQHRKLHRDLDIVLIDSEKAFGNEQILPAGPLREGPEAFDRIDKLVIVSKNIDHTRAEKYARIIGKKLKKETTICYTEPDSVYNIFETQTSLASGEKVVAFSAIGQPQQFYQFLQNYNVIKTIDFADHHIYTQNDVNKLQEICANLDVKNLITTEKDAAKLVNSAFYLKIFALKLKTKIDVEKLLGDCPCER